MTVFPLLLYLTHSRLQTSLAVLMFTSGKGYAGPAELFSFGTGQLTSCSKVSQESSSKRTFPADFVHNVVSTSFGERSMVEMLTRRRTAALERVEQSHPVTTFVHRRHAEAILAAARRSARQGVPAP